MRTGHAAIIGMDLSQAVKYLAAGNGSQGLCTGVTLRGRDTTYGGKRALQPRIHRQTSAGVWGIAKKPTSGQETGVGGQSSEATGYKQEQ